MRVKALAILALSTLLILSPAFAHANLVPSTGIFIPGKNILPSYPPDQPIFTRDDNGKTVTLKQGDVFHVRISQAVIPYNPDITVTGGLKIISEHFYPHEYDGTVGSAGTQEWNLTATKPGIQKIIVVEKPIREQFSKPQADITMLELTVNVKPSASSLSPALIPDIRGSSIMSPDTTGSLFRMLKPLDPRIQHDQGPMGITPMRMFTSPAFSRPIMVQPGSNVIGVGALYDTLWPRLGL